MVEKVIDSVVLLIFSIAITFTAVFTNAGLAVIVLGALLMVASICALVCAIMDGRKTLELFAEQAKSYEEKLEAAKEENKLLKAEITAIKKQLVAEIKKSDTAEKKPTTKSSNPKKEKVNIVE